MVGAGLDYESAPLPEAQVRLDLPYREGPEADASKHRLDLFLPSAEPGWPTLVFVHGGGWTRGDRAMGAFGIEPIRNLGRFYAARGIGVAAISYRLQPGVGWREQVDDVARAVAWVERAIPEHGGDPRAIFLGGHSAGAWLSAWVGLADAPLAAHDTERSGLCGLVLVSGAGYDMTDEQTYALGASREFFSELFGRGEPGWAVKASPRFHMDAPLLPTLILSAGGEPAKFRHQSDLLAESFEAREASVRRLTVPGQNHQRIVVSLSLDADPVSEAALAFLSETSCPAR